MPEELILNDGTAFIFCPFCKPSEVTLRLYLDGTYYCNYCNESGDKMDDERVLARYEVLKFYLREKLGQLRLPGI